MKQELEAEYLATFKKTVAMHETFLCRYVNTGTNIERDNILKVNSNGSPKVIHFSFQSYFRLAAHPIFRDDMNLAIFLEYDKVWNQHCDNQTF